MRLFLFLLAFCVANALRAQDFEPGGEARGYTDEKHTSVDMATGTFSYQIPLFSLEEGGFTLPVSLNYTGRSIKQEDTPGWVGYGWNLQAGGVVARVVRGGIADDAPKGSVHNFTTDVKSASLHRADGESDIFTVNFNGRTIKFCIRSNYKVFQLERSNVVVSALVDIDGLFGWAVTDEDGVKYVYTEREEVENRSHEASVSVNNIVNEAYTSSWFISQIIVPGADTIKFQYGDRRAATPDGGFAELDDRIEYQTDDRVYQYGRPMYEFLFGFEQYREQYEQALRNASAALQGAQGVSVRELNEFNFVFINNYGYWNKNEIIEMTDIAEGMNSVLQYQARIMGVLTGMESALTVTNGAVSMLDNIIDDCKRMGESGMAIHYLEEAKSYIRNAIVRSTQISQKRICSTSSFRLVTPVLRKIVTGDKSVEFIYNRQVTDTRTSHTLEQVGLKNSAGSLIRTARLTRSNTGCLKSVALSAPGGHTEQSQSFAYYFETDTPTGRDLWGQWTNYMIKPLEERQPGDVSPFAKKWALKEISYSTGGRIQVEYDINFARYSLLGGIRVKQIIQQSGAQPADTVRYLYPNFARYIYGQPTNRDVVSYQEGFQDVVINSRVKANEVLASNIGEAVYYDYVIEERAGRGSRACLFYVPSVLNQNTKTYFPAGLCGLPLAEASYDKDGNLVELVKNSYLPGYDTSFVDPARRHYFKSDEYSMFGYDLLWQVKPYEYYMDGPELQAYYRSLPAIPSYHDRNERYTLDPYGNIYQPNIAPRVDIVLPATAYALFYGGSSVPVERKTYRFPGASPNGPAIDHFAEVLPEGAVLASREEYKYDNHNHMFPTRVISHLSNGDELLALSMTPAEFSDDVDRAFNKMHNRNIISPVVKKQQFLRRKGETAYRLLGEEVSRFKDTLSPSGKTVILPHRRYSCPMAAPSFADPMAALAGRVLFSYAPDSYRLESEYAYECYNGRFLLAETRERAGTSAACYDPLCRTVILEAENTKRELVAAADRLRFAAAPLSEALVVAPGSGNKQFRVFMLVNTDLSALQLNYSVHQGGSVAAKTSEALAVRPGQWSLVAFDIDLTALPHTDKLAVDLPGCRVALATLTPADVCFEAMCYDAERRLFCKLDQCGGIERYAYDYCDRIVQVYDRDNNMLEESYYNF